MNTNYPGTDDQPADRVAALERRMAALEGLRTETQTGFAQVTQLLTAIQSALAQTPRRVGTEDLMNVLAQDRTRVRGLEERYHEIADVTVHNFEINKETRALVRELLERLTGKAE
jgi:hypothetical protein